MNYVIISFDKKEKIVKLLDFLATNAYRLRQFKRAVYIGCFQTNIPLDDIKLSIEVFFGEMNVIISSLNKSRINFNNDDYYSVAKDLFPEYYKCIYNITALKGEAMDMCCENLEQRSLKTLKLMLKFYERTEHYDKCQTISDIIKNKKSGKKNNQK